MGRRVRTADQLAQRRENQRNYRAAYPEKYKEARRQLKVWKMAKGPPTEEDKAKEAAQRRASNDARRARGENPWFRVLSPALKAKRAARDKARNLAHRLEGLTRKLTEDQKKRKALREAARVRSSTKSWVRRSKPVRSWAEIPISSVLACAAPSEARDLLAQITQAVPRHDDRDEIIAEACLLVLGGTSVEEAVRQAGKIVRRSAASLAYAKPFMTAFGSDEGSFTLESTAAPQHSSIGASLADPNISQQA